MRNYLRAFATYALVTIFIVGWWCIAFKHKPNDTISAEEITLSPNENQWSLQTALNLTPRMQLQEALAGNTSTMGQLILDWDVDAQLLNSLGFHHAKRLSSHEFLRSQLLSRQLKLNINKESTKRLLPQTYAASSILLALVPPEQIVALPRRLREQTQLYPKILTDKIPLDIDRHNSEKLFQAKPDIAFVAHYSHPATIQALSNQGVALYTMKNLDNLNDILEEIAYIGTLIDRPQEAELLKIFISAAMLALDNRLVLHASPPSRILYLNHHQSFTIPGPKSLTGQLLQRIGAYTMHVQNQQDWTIHIDKEQILNLDPDLLIIATENSKALERDIAQDPAFKQLRAIQQNRLHFVDEAIQETPTQYIVLAYYDLIQTLTRTP